MKKFEEAKFSISKLKGISEKNVEEHLKLYGGYVKNANLFIEKIAELSKDYEKNIYILGELWRRFSFEFNGMRNHEYYFKQFENGSKNFLSKSKIGEMFQQEFGSFENWISMFKNMATTRGIGWAMLYYDPLTKRLLNSWVDEQHLGQLNGCQTILALDMWEHSYVIDYLPSGKKKYIDDFFENLNWEVVEDRFAKLFQN